MTKRFTKNPASFYQDARGDGQSEENPQKIRDAEIHNQVVGDCLKMAVSIHRGAHAKVTNESKNNQQKDEDDF